MNPKPVIAILGATSHIARGLIDRFLRTESAQLVLFGRSRGRIEAFLDSIGKRGKTEIVAGYDSFDSDRYDAVINCVGAGAPAKLGDDRSVWFTLTEEFDNLVLNYLKTRNPAALYLNFSSGAVYGRGGNAPFREEDEVRLRVNDLPSSDYYTVARIYSEAKHRSMTGQRIADLRIFSYFSRFAEPTLGYFMTDVLKALLEKSVLETRPGDMIRDYVDPEDLFALVGLCLRQQNLNAAFDAYSAAPVGKFELLAAFEKEFGLRWRLTGGSGDSGPNGEKNIYCSGMFRAETLGYRPRFSSLDSLLNETRIRLEMEK